MPAMPTRFFTTPLPGSASIRPCAISSTAPHKAALFNSVLRIQLAKWRVPCVVGCANPTFEGLCVCGALAPPGIQSGPDRFDSSIATDVTICDARCLACIRMRIKSFQRESVNRDEVLCVPGQQGLRMFKRGSSDQCVTKL